MKGVLEFDLSISLREKNTYIRMKKKILLFPPILYIQANLLFDIKYTNQIIDIKMSYISDQSTNISF